MSNNIDIFETAENTTSGKFKLALAELGYSPAEFIKIIMSVSRSGTHKELSNKIDKIMSGEISPTSEIMFIVKILTETHFQILNIYGEVVWKKLESGFIIGDIAGYSINIKPKENGCWQVHLKSLSDAEDIPDCSIHFETLDAAKRWGILTAAYGGRLDSRHHATPA